MSERKKQLQYEFGHKRETRKSYQAFIEELMTEPKSQDSFACAGETPDDSSVRRSKRTPVPKRGFKLIDDYDSKEPSKKKGKTSNEEESDSKNKSSDDNQAKGNNEKKELKLKKSKTPNDDDDNSSNKRKKGLQLKEETNKIDEDELTPLRKSGRVRKIKSYEDSVTPGKKQEASPNIELNNSTESKRRRTLSNQNQGNKYDPKNSTQPICSTSENIDTKRKRSCTISEKDDKLETPKSRLPSKNGHVLNKSDSLIESVDSKRKRSSISNKDKSENEKINSVEIVDSKRKRSSSSTSVNNSSVNDKKENKKYVEAVSKHSEINDSKRKRNSTSGEDDNSKKELHKSISILPKESCDPPKSPISEGKKRGRPSLHNKVTPDKDIDKKKATKHSNIDNTKANIKKQTDKKVNLKEKNAVYQDCEESKKNKKRNKKEEMVPSLAESVKSRRNHRLSTSEETSNKLSSENHSGQSQNAVLTNSKQENLTKISKRKENQSSSKGDQHADKKLNQKNNVALKDKEKEKHVKKAKTPIKGGESGKQIKECNMTPNQGSLKGGSCKKKGLTSPTMKKESGINILENGSIEKLENQSKHKSKMKESSRQDDLFTKEMKKETDESPLVLTLNLSPSKKKNKKNIVSKTKLSKKVEIKKSKNKKKAKLIVSFKNNHSFQPKKKKIRELEPCLDNSDILPDRSQLENVYPEKGSDLPSPLDENQNDSYVDEDSEVSKHKKKSKKKAKAKLKKYQKLTNVQTFSVIDTTIIKVKKKKIYKKRNGEKILIRIIKNHCNRNGEVVKTETIMVDNDSPVSEESDKQSYPHDDSPKMLDDLKISKQPEKAEKKNETENLCKENQIECIKKFSFNSEKKVKEKEDIEQGNGEKKNSSKLSPEKPNADRTEVKLGTQKKVKEESPEYIPKSKSDYSHGFAKRKANFKSVSHSRNNLKTSSEKRSFSKKQRLLKKPLSRPANKNVTVGGKVVGKTTKGMKKTGDFSDPPKTVFEPIPQEVVVTPPVSEPKNVYNFFCRKYRPIVVQQFPKAGFSEISRRLAALWKTLSEVEKQEHRDKFEEIHSVSQQKLGKLNRLSPTMWSESDVKFIKKNIGENEAYAEVFAIPRYPSHRLKPIDMAAHLSLLGDSLNVISGALQQQSSMTVHGAMSVLLDSILCALAPLIFFTSHIPEMEGIDEPQQARILDNVAYILPGL